MDQARSLTSKPRKRGQKPEASQGLSYRAVHVFLGLVLLAAALCKLAESVFKIKDWSTSSLLLMTFFGVECLGGLVLVFGVAPALSHRCAVAAFTGFALSNSVHIVKGVCSCGCLGAGIAVNPWAVLLFDLAALIALLICSRPPDLGSDWPLSLLRSPVLVAIAAVIVLAGWRQGTYVTLAGRATWGGSPIYDRAITFNGPPGRLVSRTDREGHFHLRHVPAGTYVAAAMWRDDSKGRNAFSTVWVEASSCTEGFTNVEFAPKNQRTAQP